MPIDFDAVTTKNDGSALITGHFFSHRSRGTDRLIVVAVAYGNNGGSPTVTKCRYGGKDLTRAVRIVNSTNVIVSEIWYKAAPRPNDSTVEVQYSSSVYAIAAAISFTGVDQSIPVENTGSSTATGATSSSVTIRPRRPDSWILDCLATATTATPAVGSEQTSRWNVAGSNLDAAGSTKEASGPPEDQTMTWSTMPTSANFSHTAISIRAVRPKTNIQKILLREVFFDPTQPAAEPPNTDTATGQIYFFD